MSTNTVPPGAPSRQRTGRGVSAQRSAESSAAGEVLPGVDVLAELGRGAHSVVYRVRRTGPDGEQGEYALKILDRAETDTGETLVAFRREAALLASISHPGLTRIHEIGESQGRPYLLMDLVDGTPLAAVVARGPLPADRVVQVALDVVGPLTAVHRKGLVHRDLKPQNIMVLSNGEARLIDFGLATRQGGPTPSSAASLSAVGTLAYAPPEQSGMLKRPVDNRSDLYSLGVLLFECLTGRLPFVSGDVGELLRMHAVTSAPDLRAVVPGISPTLSGIVARLLAKDPDDRYQSGEDLADDLRRVREDPETPFVPGTRPRGRDRGPIEPLCGRDRELAALTLAWRSARSGRGGVCVLRGSPGAGKRRLATELAAMARDGDSPVLHGTCAQGDPVPFGPLRDAVEGYLLDVAHLPDDTREATHVQLRTAAGAAGSLLATLCPGLEVILGAPVLADGDRHDQFAVAVAGFFVDLAQLSGGLLLHLDAVQWLDDGTRRVLAALSERVSESPLLVLVTTRDDVREDGAADRLVTALGRAVVLDLVVGPLEKDSVGDLVRAHLPGIDSGSPLPGLLIDRGDGNPFVILEYLRAIVDAGLLRPFWGTWVLDEASLAELELPQDALGLVLTRMQGLSPATRELLVTAAAIGTRFRVDDLAAISRTGPGAVLDPLTEAARRRMIEPRDGGEYAFLHDSFRQALLEGLDADAVASLHRNIAEVLDGGPEPVGGRVGERVYAVAHHYGLGGSPRVPERAFVAFRAAGRLALEDHAPVQAVGFLEQAALVGGAADPEFLVLLGTALKRTGDFVQARARLEQTLELERVPLRRGAAFAQLAAIHRSTWDMKAGIEAVERGLAALGAPIPERRVALAVSSVWMFVRGIAIMLTRIGFGTVRGEDAERVQVIATLQSEAAYLYGADLNLRALLIANTRNVYWSSRLGGGAQYVRAMGFLAYPLRQLGLTRAAERALRAAEREGVRMGDPQMTAEIEWTRGAVEYITGADDGAGWTRALEEHGRWLNVGEYCDAAITMCWEAAVSGRTNETLLWADRLRHRASSSGEPQITAGLTVEAIVAIVTGQRGKAGAELHRLDELLSGCGAESLRINLHVEYAYAQLEQGEFGQPLEDAVSAFLASGVSPAMMLRTYRSIFVHHAAGRLARCRNATEDERPPLLDAARAAVKKLDRMANNPLLKAFTQAARADLSLLDGEPQRALDVLARMRSLPSDSPMLAFEVARTRARANRALGLPGEAERQAKAALAIAVDQGWPHRVRWISEEFGTGQHPTGVTRTGVDASSAFAATAGIDRQRLKALQEVSLAASRVLDPDALIRIALDETIRILTADRAFLFLTTRASLTANTAPDTGVERLVPHLGRDAAGNDVAELTGYSASLVERVWASGEALVVTGTEEGAAMGAVSVVLYGLRSIMVAPLTLEGRTLGVIYLDSQVAKGVFTDDDAGILTALTKHIATSLETARAAQLELSVQTAQQQRNLAEQLHDALQLMTGTLDPSEVLQHLLAATSRLVPCDGSWLLLDDLGDDDVQEDDVARTAVIDTGDVVVGGPGPAPNAAFTELFGSVGDVASWIALPLVARTTRLGVMLLASTRPGAFGATQTRVAAAVVAQGMTAYDNASLFARVQELAMMDQLTGIANRRHFFELAERGVAKARRSGSPLVVVMADIDHFKRVNDTYGHPTGDDVIRVVASRLAAGIRATDILGRYGGEEFALVLPDAAVDIELPERLRKAIADVPIETRSGPLDITVSIGLSRQGPDDVDIAGLLARADQGLYEAKRNGRNQVHSA